MSSQPPPPTSPTPPSDPPPGARPEPTDASPTRTWRTWQLATGVVVALLIGIAVGGAGGDGATGPAGSASDDTADAATDDRVEELEAQVTQLEGEIEDRDALIAAAEETITALEDQEPEDEPAAEDQPEDEPATTEEDGTYTAKDYTFADVQVSEDFVGDFEIRARATNDGSAKGGVAISATLFSEGSVVGTASGVVSDWDAGRTVTLEMISTDDYTDWDEIEFQIDTEY